MAVDQPEANSMAPGAIPSPNTSSAPMSASSWRGQLPSVSWTPDRTFGCVLEYTPEYTSTQVTKPSGLGLLVKLAGIQSGRFLVTST
ncbi:unnamed protein product [Phytophthora lilii]|uniref:Unnamed protein product n=1 Tax=Phytophthora lilii TaxID=2077276 RepID=A0A9W6TR80_9STRA|nr:unnamed protein product [Phytophthora lilii]